MYVDVPVSRFDVAEKQREGEVDRGDGPVDQPEDGDKKDHERKKVVVDQPTHRRHVSTE